MSEDSTIPLKLVLTRLYNSLREWILDDINQIIGKTIVGGKLNGSQISGTIPASTIPDTAVAPGSYGDATHVGRFTVEADGRLTFAQDVAITSANMEVTQHDGATDVTTVSKIVLDNNVLTNDGSGTIQIVSRPQVAPGDPTTAEGDLIYRHITTTASITVGFIGDSITANIPSGGSQTPPDATVANLSVAGLTVTANNQGHGGANSGNWLPSDVSGYFNTAVSAFQGAGVRIVHIMLGTNDSTTTTRISTATFLTNMQTICQQLVSDGFIVVLSYCPFSVLGSDGGIIDATSQTLEQGYQAQINKLVNGRTILLGATQAWDFFKDNTGDMSDGVHPNVAGVAAYGAFWANALSLIVKSITSQVVLARLPVGSSATYIRSNGTLPAYSAILAADLPVMVGSGASHAPGAAPDPGSTAGTTHFLREDGTWAVPSGSVVYAPLTDPGNGSPSLIFDNTGDVIMTPD